MGFGSFMKGLGKVALAGAEFIPGVGAVAKGASALGKLAKAGKVAGALAPTLTGLAAGKQKGREAENTAAQDTARFQLNERGQHEGQVMDRAGLDLQRRQFGLTSQNNAYTNAMKSALALNTKDVGINGVPKDVPVISFSGGSRPSAIGPEGRAAASAMNAKAMTSLMNGETYDPMDPLERTAPATFQKPGTMENILGGAAAAANGVAGVQAGNAQQTMQQKILDAIAKLNASPRRSVLDSTGDALPPTDSGNG